MEKSWDEEMYRPLDYNKKIDFQHDDQREHRLSLPHYFNHEFAIRKIEELSALEDMTTEQRAQKNELSMLLDLAALRFQLESIDEREWSKDRFGNDRIAFYTDDVNIEDRDITAGGGRLNSLRSKSAYFGSFLSNDVNRTEITRRGNQYHVNHRYFNETAKLSDTEFQPSSQGASKKSHTNQKGETIYLNFDTNEVRLSQSMNDYGLHVPDNHLYCLDSIVRFNEDSQEQLK